MAPATLQPSALALVVTPAVVSTGIVITRVWKRVTTRKLAIEDVLLVIAQVLIIVFTYTTWNSYKKSWYGYHQRDIPAGAINKVEASKWGFANAVVYNPILGLIKASFIITLLKLRSPNRWVNRALWTIFTINGLFTIAAPLVCVFQCTPISRFWDKSKPGSCIDGPSYTYGTISVVIITDVMVVIMPTWIIYGLQMPLNRKIIFVSFLSFGLAVTGIGAYRLWVFYNLYNPRNPSRDTTYSVRQGLSNLEVSLASIGACGGTVRWLFSYCIPVLRDDHSRLLPSKSERRSDSSNTARRHGGGDTLDTETDYNEDISQRGDAEGAREEEPPRLVPREQNTTYRVRARGSK